jgi:hypothetical protein
MANAPLPSEPKNVAKKLGCVLLGNKLNSFLQNEWQQILAARAFNLAE